MLLIFALLLQDPFIDDHVNAFLKGDAAAKAELAKLGPYAIRPLLAARDRSPEKVEELLFELKAAAARPADAELVKKVRLARGPGMFMVNLASDRPWATDELLGLPLFIDRIDRKRMKSELAPVHAGLETRQQALDQICSVTGLDYGFFHGFVVIGHPERLWPAGMPEKNRELTPEDREKAAGFIEAMDEELVETRERAIRGLKSFGPAIIPILREHLDRKEPGISAGCMALIKELQPKAPSAFAASGFTRQALTPAQQEQLRRLQIDVPGTVRGVRILDVAESVAKRTGVTIRVVRNPHGQFSMVLKNHNALDLLCVVAQSLELDVGVQGGEIVVDSREAINQLVLTTKGKQ